MDSDDRYFELLRALTPGKRLEIASRLSVAVRQLAEAGLRQRHPLAGPEELRSRLTVLLYGREAALRLHGNVPKDAVEASSPR